ncbi:MAG TPA: thiamine ABC transporter substrate-binding protein [Candidatus Thermoplasmatota archaeon]|nr:thiamine ABC transporter substrate-binding protein [Candidatus Thermoplasmatota archaeon]
MRNPLFVIALLTASALAGCVLPEPAGPRDETPAGAYRAMGFNGTHWPDLEGARVTILSYDAFRSSFNKLAAQFTNLTNGTAVLITEEDTGRVLQRATLERGAPSFDVIYGIDNVLLGRATRDGVFRAYEPTLASRIDPAFALGPKWPATPVSHGYIAVNVDPRANLTIETLDDVRAHADRFVTEDPRTSTPGLGFLIATVGVYGEDDDDDYLDYWKDLFDGGVLVTSSWTDAYVNHFTGGYGQWETGARVDRPIVTSYTTSPAYEMYYGYDTLNANVLAPNATFHQIQTMGVANGTKNLAAAEAWIEFTLTDAFQATLAEQEAIYPVARSVSVESVFAGRDPAPGTFQPAPFDVATLDAKVEGWVRAWTDLYERHRASA